MLSGCSVVTGGALGLWQWGRQRLGGSLALCPPLEEAGGLAQPPPPHTPPQMFAILLLLLTPRQVEPALWGLIKPSQLLPNTDNMMHGRVGRELGWGEGHAPQNPSPDEWGPSLGTRKLGLPEVLTGQVQGRPAAAPPPHIHSRISVPENGNPRGQRETLQRGQNPGQPWELSCQPWGSPRGLSTCVGVCVHA
jgi:hypothetical protein